MTLAASVWIYSRQQHAAEVVRFVVMPPFGATRPAGHAFAISPDRRVVAFRAVGAGGVGHIFVRRLDQAEAQPVPGTDHGRSPFWAPDSRSLGFMKEDGLYRTDLDGNAPRRLCEVSGSSTDSADATWGSRGIIVFSSNKGGLFQAADTGGPPAPLTSLDAAAGEGSHRVPWFLPDGRHVLFLARTLGQTRGVIWAVSIDDGVRTRVAESSGGAAYVDGWLLTTTAAPRELVAQPFDPRRLMVTGNPQPVRDRLKAADSNGTAGFSVSSAALAVERPPGIIHQLTWMDRAGRTLDTVGPAVVTSEFSLAPDERRVVANVNDRASLKADLWVFELPNDEGTRLTFRQDSRRPMWALDGRHVYFTTAPSYELRTVAIGAEPEPFDGAGDLLHFEDATRDGRYLIFKSQPNPFSRIWLQRVGVPSERRVMVQGQFDGAQARVSPTGRWLAYSRQLPRGPEVFVQPFDRPGDQIQVSRTGGMGPVWRADNRELFYESAGALMAAPVTERGAAIDVGTPQKLFRVHTQGNVANQPHNVEVAANGQKFLVNTIVGDSDNVPIEVTLNWTAGLKR